MVVANFRMGCQMVCAWRLYKEKEDILLLQFTCHAAIAIMTEYDTQEKNTGHLEMLKGPATSSVRFNKAHN